MKDCLLVIGYSARAAAASAVRSGFSPLAIDAFADHDLRQTSSSVRCVDYPDGVEAAISSFPKCPWIYTGGLENTPELVDRLASERPLYGNAGKELRQVRDPFLVCNTLRQAGLPALDVLRCEAPVPPGSWLCKPVRSSGGGRIVYARPGMEFHGRSRYLQRYVRGLNCSAIYLAGSRRCQWLGTTQQLSGTAWTGARGFQYCGSIGPMTLSPHYRKLFQRLGDCLAARFSLRGLFGVDCVLSRGTVWPLEVNPRYTASVEVLERACSIGLLRYHVAACTTSQVPDVPMAPDLQRWGKAIVYASGELQMTEGLLARLQRILPEDMLADIPQPGTKIEAEQPLLTVFAEGQTALEVMLLLKRRAADVRTLTLPHVSHGCPAIPEHPG